MNRRNVKNVRIVKHLIERPDGRWTKYKLAKASGCSRQWVIQFIRKLEELELVVGTRVKDPMGLIRFGADATPKPHKVLNLFHTDPIEFVREQTDRYAFTTYSAENMVTHHLFPHRYDVYLDMETMHKVYERTFIEGWLGAGNTRLIVPVDGTIVDDVRYVGDVRVVGMGQLLIDLVKEGGVAEESVQEMIRRDVWRG